MKLYTLITMLMATQMTFATHYNGEDKENSVTSLGNMFTTLQNNKELKTSEQKLRAIFAVTKNEQERLLLAASLGIKFQK